DEVFEEGAAEEVFGGVFGVGHDGGFDVGGGEAAEGDGGEVDEVGVDALAVGDDHVDDGGVGAGGEFEFAGEVGGEADQAGGRVDDHAAGGGAVEGDQGGGDAALGLEFDDGVVDGAALLAEELEALGEGGAGADAVFEAGVVVETDQRG